MPDLKQDVVDANSLVKGPELLFTDERILWD